VRTVAAVVVGVHVQHHERAGGRKRIQPGSEVGVQILMDRARDLRHLLRQGRVMPDLQIPTVLGPAIDGLVGGPIHVDLEAGPVDLEPGRDVLDDQIRERILLPEPVRLGEGHERHELRAQVVTRMDGRRDDGPVPRTVEGISNAAHPAIKAHCPYGDKRQQVRRAPDHSRESAIATTARVGRGIARSRGHPGADGTKREIGSARFLCQTPRGADPPEVL